MHSKRISCKLIIFLLIILLILYTQGCGSKENDLMWGKTSINYSIKNAERQVGYPQKLTSFRDDLTYDIQYPQTKDDKIDYILSCVISNKIADFTSNNAKNTANITKNRKELYGSYQSFAYGENNVSIEMQYLKKDLALGTNTEEVETLVFSNGELITADKVFRNNRVKIVVDAIKKAFISKGEYKNALKNGQLDNKLCESINTIKNFVFSNESVIFFFDKGSVLPENYGVCSICIPMENLKEAFSLASPYPFESSVNSAKDAIEQGMPLISLTFDDGPMEQNTLTILDELKRYNAHATFFVVGKQATIYPDILKREMEQNCEIGNHTYSHPFLNRLSCKNIASEINRNNEIIENITGFIPKLVRPPYGIVNKNVTNTIQLPLILWSVDTKDWKTKDTRSTIDKVLNEANDGQIILMHDIQASTVEAAKIIIPSLIDKGYYLATVSEMFEAKGLIMGKGNVYKSAN